MRLYRYSRQKHVLHVKLKRAVGFIKSCSNLLLLFIGSIGSIFVSSQAEESELLLPAKLELLERLRGWWGLLVLEENLRPFGQKSLEKKQLSSSVVAELRGLGEQRSPKTLCWSLSSVIPLL